MKVKHNCFPLSGIGMGKVNRDISKTTFFFVILNSILFMIISLGHKVRLFYMFNKSFVSFGYSAINL